MSEMLVGVGYGRTMAIRGNAESLGAAQPLLPFWWEESSGVPEKVFDLNEPDAAPLILRNLERWTAEHAVGMVFVHAAVVALEGVAVVLPGWSHSGKTTLCVELLRRGATYFSDEYAVLDADGLVHPYPRPLQVRDGDARLPMSAASLGAASATAGVSVRLVALLEYDADAGWSVEEVSPATAVLALLAHTLPAQLRSEESLDVVRAALDGVACISGSRGPAVEAVDPLLALLRKT